jgi:hypothetical protein
LEAGKEVIVAFPAESRVAPGKPADHTPVHPFPVHDFKKVFQPGKAGFFISIKEGEGFVPGAIGSASLSNLFRKQVGVSVDDHGGQWAHRNGALILPAFLNGLAVGFSEGLKNPPGYGKSLLITNFSHAQGA